MRFALPLLRLLILLALMLTGTVPAGMMRHADEDGIRLVLCTSDGVKEVLLNEDGSTAPAAAKDGQDNGMPEPHCVQVVLATTEAPSRLPDRHGLAPGCCDLAMPDDQIPHLQTDRDARHSRAPPIPA